MFSTVGGTLAIVGTLLVGIAILGSVAGSDEKSETAKDGTQVATSEPAPRPDPPSDEELIEATVAAMRPSSIYAMCDAVKTFGYQLSFNEFNRGYTTKGIPAQAAFDGILEECP